MNNLGNFHYHVMLLDTNMLLCHVCMHTQSQLCLILCDPADCILPGSSVHGVFQIRILERLAISDSICHVYAESFWKAKIRQIESRVVVARSWGFRRDADQKVQSPTYKMKMLWGAKRAWWQQFVILYCIFESCEESNSPMFHHKKKKVNSFLMMLTNFILVTIFEYINISDHYVVDWKQHLK